MANINQIEVPTPVFIKDLFSEEFFIPAYQRGYRWTEKDVFALLDDINEFEPGPDNSPNWYCLQPLIVKKRSDGRFEVVDGQQRLTTIYIFLKLIQSETHQAPFRISFETRERSKLFLENINGILDDFAQENIDFFHMKKAYQAMEKWLRTQEAGGNIRFNVISTLFKKITVNVFFIWHKIPENSKPEEIFNRVNLGKIKLSNSELIKALILNKDNFLDNSEKEQEEFSLSWNRIERGLKNESFWQFLNDKSIYDTRIDLIFSLIAEQCCPNYSQLYKSEDYPIFLPIYESYKKDANVPGLNPSQRLQKKTEFVHDLWKEVERIYDLFQEWYNDLDKYHVIGYLITCGIPIKKIFEIVKGRKKSESVRFLIDKTRETVGLKNLDDIRNLSFANPKPQLRRIFLLFNIATLVNKQEKQYRFSFEMFKKEKWDIEHIHATADRTEEADDSIGNLTILSAEINRSYQEACFSKKRTVIIKKDSEGDFIPLCTKNIFTKQYTKNVLDMNSWGTDDKEDYVNAIHETLDAFWKGQINNG